VLFDFANILMFLLVAVVFVAGALIVGALIRPHLPSPDKASTYECGERPVGRAWFNFNPRFYVIALTFLIFDVEVALALPVAVVFRKWLGEGRGTLALIELLLFILVLAVGLAFVWGKGNLEWIRELKEPHDHE
jgi:NADH-quinone oxidoreductase subunit A